MQVRKTEWHEKFISALRDCGVVRIACRAAAVDRSTCYKHKEKYPEFSQQWDEAIADASDLLESAMYRRAIGYLEPVFDKAGNKIGDIKKYSPVEAIFLMKGMKPEKYGERFPGMINNANNQQIIVQFPPDVAKPRLQREPFKLPGEENGA